FGPISGSSLISANVRSITSRNSLWDLKVVMRSPAGAHASGGARGCVRRECTVRTALSDPIHLHPTAPLAERVLLPGDPGRALLLAQALLTKPAMFNHHRGLWGYTGLADDGSPLTIQSTGMGGPSAAIVITELAELGARRLLRVGTCGALNPALALGELVIVTESIPADGTSRALGAQDTIRPDEHLLAALLAAGEGGASAGPVVSTDLFYD